MGTILTQMGEVGELRPILIKTIINDEVTYNEIDAAYLQMDTLRKKGYYPKTGAEEKAAPFSLTLKE